MREIIKVLFCASEVTPFAKTGGLADVAGSLPLALSKLGGVEILIMMPRYRGIVDSQKKLTNCVSICFVESEAYFNRHSLYGNNGNDYPDNLERFSFFCHEALRLAKAENFKPDIIHAHDWQSALLPVLLKTKFASDSFFKNTKSVLTIHNLAYQGHFAHRLYSTLDLPEDLFSVDGFEFYGKGNLLKGGILFADQVTTVSPTYAKEILTKEYGYGLEGVVQKRQNSLHGILNGIDNEFWDPATDKKIYKNFSSKDPSGKAECKKHLQEKLGLEVDPKIPIFAVVSRLAEQKGLGLFLQIADRFLEEPVQFVLLGEGDEGAHHAFRTLAAHHKKNVRVFLEFNVANAHEIYAGADFFLMPSLYEPCGLGQLISFRYGTIPVVRKTGGLADTVMDVDKNKELGNGFVFEEKSAASLAHALKRALDFFHNQKSFSKLSQRVMRLDYSWENSAKSYKQFYKEML